MYNSTVHLITCVPIPAGGEHVTIVIDTTEYLVVPTYMKPIALERSQVLSYREKVNKTGRSTVTKSNVKIVYIFFKH
jgi:hypothetical protein